MTIQCTRRAPYDVRKVVDELRHPAQDLFLLAAHRGHRWSGIPENSTKAVLAAAELGLAMIEVDVRLTSDGIPVILHDDTIGRVTNIAEHLGRTDVYSPFTGRGYSPLVKEVPWFGMLDQLRLKEEHGRITQADLYHRQADGSEVKVLTLFDMVQFIREQAIDIVVLLDVKDKGALDSCAQIINAAVNCRGVPGAQWMVYKLDCSWYPMPVALEQEHWWMSHVHEPLLIPVYEPEGASQIDLAVSISAYTLKPYVVCFEMGLRAPGGFMQKEVDYLRKRAHGMGYFAALGDLWKWDDKEILYDLDGFKTPWQVEGRSEQMYIELDTPHTYDEWLQPGQSPDGHDYRASQAVYRDLGFSWTITDNCSELLEKLRACGLRDGESRLYRQTL